MQTSSGTPPAAVARRLRLQRAGVIGITLILPLTFLPWAWTPFIEPKMVVLAVATILLVTGVRKADPAIALASGAWVGILVLAGALGVDRAWSLTGPEILGNGLLLLVPCALLAVLGSGLGRDIARALPRYIVWTGLVCAVVAIVDRFIPGITEALIEPAGLPGGTVGHPVILSGLMAAAVVASFAPSFRPAQTATGRGLALLVVTEVLLASGLALSGKRAGWVALAVGLVIVAWRMRPDRRTLATILAASLITLATWTAIDAIGIGGSKDAPLSGAGAFVELGQDASVQSRLITIPALLEGVADRPLLGWGPGNTWSAYLPNVDEADLASGERGIGDAHNIVLESAVTTGIVGLAAFLWLLLTLFRRGWKARGEDGWAPALFLTLLVFHVFQPMTLSLLPMLFLSAGVAAALGRMQVADEQGASTAPAWKVPRWLRGTAAAILSVAAIFAVFATASAVSHYLGRDLSSGAPLRAAVALNPLNLEAEKDYAIGLVTHGDPEAARAIALDWVTSHPENPAVRLRAAQIFYLSGDDATAKRLESEHLEIFPADGDAVAEAKPVSVPAASAP